MAMGKAVDRKTVSIQMIARGSDCHLTAVADSIILVVKQQQYY